MSRFISITLSLCTILCLVSCAHRPAIDAEGNLITRPSSSFLKNHGARQFDYLKRTKQVSTDPRHTEQVNRVATKLQSAIDLPEAEWEFVIFKDHSPNAFALPGGKVGINTGLFSIVDSDALLAAVLGHEIAHASSAHANQRMRHAAAVFIGGALLYYVLEENDADHPEQAVAAYALTSYLLETLPLSRRQEYESDRIGAIYMAQAGYNPRQMIELWKRLSLYHTHHGNRKPEFLRTHPKDANRIRSLREFMPIAMKHYHKSRKKE